MVDALAQFKLGKGIDIPESAENIAKDEEYKKPLKTPLAEQKLKLSNSWYGKFNDNKTEIDKNGQEDISEPTLEPTELIEPTESIESTESTESTTNDLNKSKIEDNKYFPIVKRLYESEQITKETYDLITVNIKENNGELKLDNLAIETDEKKLIDGYINELDVKNEDKNILNFGKDIKGIEEFMDFNTELDKNGKFDSDVLNIIGKNYLQIKVGDKKIDPKQDISTAIGTTKNQLLKDVKNIPKDSQTYLTSIQNIGSGNLKKQIEGINSLYVLSYSSEGKLDKKELNNYTSKRKEELKARAREITIEMNNPNNKNDVQKINKLKLEKVDIIKEANEIDGGDVFEAGDMDKVSEKISSGKENKA